MDKFAQKRSVLNKLREMTNVSGISAEKFFNPEFQKVMIDLRLKDDHIRSVVAGEVIGDGDPGNDPISLKQLLKSCKSNLNRREYMSAISDIGRFHAKIFEIEKWISQLDNTVNEVHHEFLFKDLDDERVKHLHDLKQRFAAHQSELIKRAGIMDFFHNITSSRGRALAAWEKRYPKKTAQLKKETSNILLRSEALLSTILSSLKEMATSRANRNVDDYMKSAQKIIKANSAYDKLFRSYYENNVKDLMKYIEINTPEEKSIPAKPEENLSFKKNLTVEPDPFPNMRESVPDTIKQDQINFDPESSKESNLPFNLVDRKNNSMDPVTLEEVTKELPSPVNTTQRSPNRDYYLEKSPESSNTNIGNGLNIRQDSSRPFGDTIPSPGVVKNVTPSNHNSNDPFSKSFWNSVPPTTLPRSTLQYFSNQVSPNKINTTPSISVEKTPTMMGIEPPGRIPTLPGVAPPAVKPGSEQSGTRPRMSPEEMRNLENQFGISESSHKNFYRSLQSMGNESPIILRRFISKYAKKIEASDPATSIQLLKIVKNIKG